LDGNKIFEILNKSKEGTALKCVTSGYDPVFDIMILSYEEECEVRFVRERG
jgi:hypothetical protein